MQILSIRGGGGDYRRDFTGTITVHNQHGARMEIDPASVQVDLRTVGTGDSADQSLEGVFGRTMPPRTKSAKNRADYDDESTFGALWETHDFIADLPTDWRLKLDFKDEGEKQKWYAGGVDEAD